MGSQGTGKGHGGPTPMDVMMAGKVNRPSMAEQRSEASSDVAGQGAAHASSSPSSLPSSSSASSPLSSTPVSSSVGVSPDGSESETSGGGLEGMEELVNRFPELARVDDLGLEEQVKVYQSALDALQRELHGQD